MSTKIELEQQVLQLNNDVRELGRKIKGWQNKYADLKKDKEQEMLRQNEVILERNNKIAELQRSLDDAIRVSTNY